jgi:hypothetical protein
MRYGPPLQVKLPTFHNPNKGSRVVHSTHNRMSHCHLLSIYTCHLTYRSFSRVAPHSCPKAGYFQLLQHTHQRIWTKVLGVINLGVVNELPSAGEASDL